MEITNMRINKYLASQGIASRRKVDELLSAGRVLVNGQHAQLGQRINPLKDQITVDGKSIVPAVSLEYIMLNKPKGVVSTASDEFNRPKVVDLVPSKNRLFPVGRLDEDSHGLILLTNDGALAQKLTHPKFQMPKTYQLVIQGSVSEAKVTQLQKGIYLKDGKTLPTQVKVLSVRDNRTVLELTLSEGRNRQIRRMCGKLNLILLDLKRVTLGPVSLGNLKTGAFRSLTQHEISLLLLDNP